MKKSILFLVIIFVFSIAFATQSFAGHNGNCKGNRGNCGNYCGKKGTNQGRMYNVNTVETIKGEIVKVENINQGRGRGYGVHLIVKTDKEEIPVHIGPSWYLNEKNIKFEVKDKVEIKGSRITYQNQPTIIAGELKKNNETLKLRNEDGTPLWSKGNRN